MRTLKKTLCLVLVLVMMAGLCSIGTSAAFVDADKINYTQAAEVLNALGVMKGDENGFRPQDTITRAEACVMIVRLLDAEGIKGTASFTDLAGYGWAKDAIAYCEAEGIVAGNGDGTFNPAGKLTGYAFAKMLFCACGYNADAEGMTGANWEIGVAKLVKSEEIAKAIAGFDGTAACTREEAAQLAFKSLTDVSLRKYLKGTTVGSGDITVSVGGEYDPAYNIGGTMTLLSENFKALRTAGYNALKQPIKNYSDSKAIDFDVVDIPVATFTAETKADAVATALKGYKLDVTLALGGTDVAVKIDNINELAAGDTINEDGNGSADPTDTPVGALLAKKTPAAVIAGLTGAGVLVEVYANPVNKVVTDIVVNTYDVAKVTKVETVKKTGDVKYYLQNLTDGEVTGTAYVDFADKDVADEIVFAVAPAAGDIVTVANNSASVKYIYATTNFTGSQSAITSDNKTVTVAGTKYALSANKAGTFTNGAAVNTYYVDQFGAMVYNTGKAASTDYAFILAADGKSTTKLGETTFEVNVRAILADGTVGTYAVALEKSGANTYIKGQPNGATALKETTELDTYGTAEVDAQADALENNIFGYTLADGVISLELLKADSDTTEKAVVQGQAKLDTDTSTPADGTPDTVTLGKVTYITNDSTSNKVMLDKAVPVIAYDSTPKTATVFNGTGALPTGFADVNVFYVGKVNASGNVVASAIFVLKAVDSSGGTDLVYIDAWDYNTKYNGTKNVYDYTAINADGEKVVLTSETLLNTTTPADESGLYIYDGTTVKPAFAKRNASGSKTSDNTAYDSNIVVEGNIVDYGGAQFGYITENTKVVTVKAACDGTVNGNGGYIVFEKANGVVSKNIAVIFLTVKNP